MTTQLGMTTGAGMNRTALITGAGSRLAHATARLLAQAGWSLAIVGDDRTTLAAIEQDLVDDAPSPGGSIKIALVNADPTDGAGAVYAVETARALLDRPLGGMVDCTGDGFFTLGAFSEQMELDDQRGAAVLVRVEDRSATPPAADLTTLVEAAAATYAPQGLRVNGLVRPLNDAVATSESVDRWGEVVEVAETVRWLLSDDAAWITGQVLHGLGGRHRPSPRSHSRARP